MKKTRSGVVAVSFLLMLAAAHTAGGAMAMAGRWPGLRRDVDTVDDLWAAAELGLGPASAAALGMSAPPGAVALS